MTAFRVVLFLVATLVLWYLGNMTLKAVWEAFDLTAPSPTVQALNLALLPLSALVTWVVLRRVRDDGPDGGRPEEGNGGAREDVGASAAGDTGASGGSIPEATRRGGETG